MDEDSTIMYPDPTALDPDPTSMDPTTTVPTTTNHAKADPTTGKSFVSYQFNEEFAQFTLSCLVKVLFADLNWVVLMLK